MSFFATCYVAGYTGRDGETDPPPWAAQALRKWQHSRVECRHVPKLRLILATLDAAEAPGDMDVAGWRLHPLKGPRKSEWSVWVSGNWRVTFRFDGTDATDVNLEDYH